MLVWHTASSEVKSDASDVFDSWLESVGKGFRRLMEPARRAQARTLRVEPSVLEQDRSLVEEASLSHGEPQLVRAELLVKGHALYCVTISRYRGPVRVKSRGSLELRLKNRLILDVGYLGPSIEASPLAQIVTSLSSQFGVEFNINAPRIGRRMNDILEDSQLISAEISDVELPAAMALRPRLARRLAIAIKSASGLLSSDLRKSVNEPEATDDAVAHARTALEQAGIVGDEIVVICKRTSGQINKLPSFDVLDQLGKRGVRCSCGRAINEERAEEAVTVTSLGDSLLDKSRWMGIVLVSELEAMGVGRDRIYLEALVNGDEVDCLADVYGSLVMFELKDKPFNLGNAYSFGSKQSIFDPDYAVIVTTEHVGNDAKDHFSRSRNSSKRRNMFSNDSNDTAEIIYVEGLADLPAALASLVTKISKVRARRTLSRVLAKAALGPMQLMGVLETRSA